MVTLISYPDALSLSQNLKKIVASADGQSAFLLYKNGELVIDETYFPDESGTIEIDIRELVTSLLSVSVPTSDTFTQNNSVADFTATIGDKEIVFRTVKGGIAGSTHATDWLTANFLTWQPQIKSVTYMQPEWLTYYAQEDCQIKCRLYNQDKSNTDIILATISAGQCISVNTQFARIINLNETAKLAYYDIWVESLNTTRLSYAQRYILRDNTSQENYFIFENSVGGMDAVSFTGNTNLEAETEHELAAMDDMSIQASQKMQQWLQQSTGYKSAYEAKWLQDFFTSPQRYVCKDGQIKEIVIQDSALSDSSSEAVKEYSFTYRYADDRGLLQLDRDMAMPANIEFPTADQIFFLAPRLSDFSEAEINPFLVIPVQSPYEEVWYRISVGSIQTLMQQMVVQGLEGNVHDHWNKKILDNLSDIDGVLAYNGLKINSELLQVLGLDHEGNIYIKKKDNGSGRIFKTQDAIYSLTNGKGTIIQDGLIQTDRLEVRGSMTIMDLIINQLQGIAADFLFTDIGKVTKVNQLDSSTYVLTLERKTDSDFTTLRVDDILHQIVNSIPIGGQDYYSSWMRVSSVNIASNTVSVVLYGDGAVPGGKNHPPIAGYNVARKGNVVLPDKGISNDRAQIWMLSSREGRIQFLQNVFKPILEDYNYALTLGKLPNIAAIRKLPVTTDDVGLVAQTAIVEKLYQFDYNGDIVANKVDRGQWSAEIAASEQPYRNIQHKSADPTGNTYTLLEQHTVWYMGCRWGCLTDSTLAPPAWNSPHWVLLEGYSELEMRFSSSNGNAFYAGRVDTLITPSVYMGNIDISDDIAAIDWAWVYERGTVAGRILHLTNDIIPANWSRTNKAKFTCTAYVRVGENDVQPVSNEVII